MRWRFSFWGSIQYMRTPLNRKNAARKNVALAVSLLAWVILFVRQYLQPEYIAWLSPLVPALLAVLALVLIVPVAYPTRLKAPVVLVSVLTVIAGLLLLGIRDKSESLEYEWNANTTLEIGSTLDAVGKRIQDLLDVSTTIGEDVTTFVRGDLTVADADTMGLRLDAFDMLGALSERIKKQKLLPAGTEIGIQLFDASGKRTAWAGWPQQLDSRDMTFVASGSEHVYSRQISLYRILTHVIPVYPASPGDAGRDDEDPEALVATIVVDMPLEVNYKVNNKFLNSTSLADDIARGSAANIRFDYPPPTLSLPENAGSSVREPVTAERIGEISGNESVGLNGRAAIRSPHSNPLFNATVYSPPFDHFVDGRNKRFVIFADLAVLLALLILFGTSLKNFSSRLVGPGNVLKAAYLVAVFALIRYSLLWLQPGLFASQADMFEPAVFATPILGGLMRSAGDLFITSVFFVVALYGVLKITRERKTPAGETAGNPPGYLFLIKGAFAGAFAMGVFELARRFIGSVVTNANPRLVGETISIFDTTVAVLHLSAFLMVAGIFLAGMIFVWGVYRLKGRADTGRASVVASVVVIVVSLVLFRIDLAVISLLVLLFMVFAPRIVQREDLVSIVTVAFGFVIIVSAAAYVFFNDEYQELRRTFIQEKVAEVTDPSDNWKVFILEDILETLSQDISIRRALRDPYETNLQRLAFDLWAESSLSLLGYSCSINVFDEADSIVSRFAVEMPYRIRSGEVHERLETPSTQQWVVFDLTTQTPQGAVRFYRGIVNLEDYLLNSNGVALRIPIGKIVVDIPFYFESLVWAARTGPQTPEVLRNVQEGGIAPRLEETEALLLARLRGSRVFESSSEYLPVGYTFDPGALERAANLGWPLLKTGGMTYRFLSHQTDPNGTQLVAGFRVPSPAQHLLRWSTVLSLYFAFTVTLIILIIVLKQLPFLSRVLPTLTPGRQFGFQQKLLGSFLVVALLPAVILGVFSVRLMKDRFVEENNNEAVFRSNSAEKALSRLIVDERDTILEHYDTESLIAGDLPSFWSYDTSRQLLVWVESATPAVETDILPGVNDGGGGAFDGDYAGEDSTVSATDVGQDGNLNLGNIVRRVSPNQAFVHFNGGRPYLGVVTEPFTLVIDGEMKNCVVYFARLVNADLLGEVSDQVGADVNLYEGGELVGTSREGLLSGGFISSMMNADAFMKVSMMGVDQSLATEQAGRYRYQVAYVPVPSLDPSANAAIGVPLLFRPESYTVEVEKATSVVLSLFALLCAATIGLGLLLARGIFEPLKGLLEGTRRIARGDFSFTLPSTRRDEIGAVVEAFNEMTHQVSHSQAALEERRRYLEVILVNIAAGVISTDSDDHVRAVNEAAERILGVRGDDLVGKTVDDLVDADVQPDFFKRFRDSAPDGSPVVSSEVDVVMGGHKRTIKYMRTGMSTEGRYLGTVIVFEDLTELINSKKLSAWVEMARQIAHEIKNPLTPIKLSTQFMVRAHQEKSEDFDKIFTESSETIIQQVDVLRNIASEFSSFGRLQQLDLSVKRIVPLVEDIVAPYRRNASGVGVAFDVSSRDLEALIDPEALRKICTNLIENAMEAMPQGGGLRVLCDEVPYDGGKMVRVSVSDTGPGLSDDVQDRLFEPYFSTKTTGTGLGLAICRSLSREMGGEVTVESGSSGVGVEATLYLKPA